jgi:hypothetical protein
MVVAHERCARRNATCRRRARGDRSRSFSAQPQPAHCQCAADRTRQWQTHTRCLTAISDASAQSLSRARLPPQAAGPLWVQRMNWRQGAFLLVSPRAAYGAGVLKGGLSAISFSSLGDATNPDRPYAESAILQAVLAAIVAVPLAVWIVPTCEAFGVFAALGLAIATGLHLSMDANRRPCRDAPDRRDRRCA